MWIFILEAVIALGLLLFIVWATWPRSKHGGRAGEQGGMQLNADRALHIAQEFIKNKGYKEPTFSTPRFEAKNSRHSTEPVDYWVVPFAYEVFGQEEGDFVYLEDKTGQIMYVLNKHGRSFIGGKPAPTQEDQDGDRDD